MHPTLTQHILQAQHHDHPLARGKLTSLITQIGVVAKVLSATVRRAGLLNALGSAGSINVQGEQVQKLDVIAHRSMVEILLRSGQVAGLVSEEEEEWIEAHEDSRGDYIVVFDPLDGSSNIDVNVSVGTLWAIYARASQEPSITNRDVLRPGRDLIAAGYAIYGSATMFVYSAGAGVHGFTLDPGMGEFLLSHPDMHIPGECKLLSINDCNDPYWYTWTTELVRRIKARNDADKRRVTARFIGSCVADIHRNLIKGGLFVYPPDRRNPKGRLRLLYECIPMAYIVEQAGGAASNGLMPILDVVPHSLHQRSTLIIGNKEEVALAEELVRQYGLNDNLGE